MDAHNALPETGPLQRFLAHIWVVNPFALVTLLWGVLSDAYSIALASNLRNAKAGKMAYTSEDGQSVCPGSSGISLAGIDLLRGVCS